MNTILYTAWLESPLGQIFAVGDKTHLHLLEFFDRKNLDTGITRMQKKLKATFVEGKTPPIISIEKELQAYFKGELREFKTPIFLSGTDFQKQVWQALTKIPTGRTESYASLAKSINLPKAFRAVARANSTNQLAIIVPCHRVINTNGALGGYAAGIERKQWLLKHENICAVL